MAKITKTFVDKIAAPAEGYEMHWDDSVKGYGLRVSKEGKKVFMVMGRVAGKSIQFTLGPYGTLTEAKARERAQKVLQDMREGIDPRAVVKADAAAKVSLQDVLEAYVGRPGKMKDSTAREYRRHVEKTFAKWAPLPIASITRDMVKDRHAALVKGGLDGKKGAPARMPRLSRSASSSASLPTNIGSRTVRRLSATTRPNAGGIWTTASGVIRFGFRCRRRLSRCSSRARVSSARMAPKVPSCSQAGAGQAG